MRTVAFMLGIEEKGACGLWFAAMALGGCVSGWIWLE